MTVNQEALYDTRPWKVFGEGPKMASAAPISAQGFNEGRGKPFTAQDVRFTRKGGIVYAFVMGAPTNAVSITSLGTKARLLDQPIQGITLLGSDEPVKWEQTPDALIIEKPVTLPSEIAVTFKITPKS
jgi:alpha-L-fucosidase